MKKVKATTNKYVTHKELESLLGEQSKVIIGAVDTILNKRLDKVNVRFDGVDKHISEVESSLSKKIDGAEKRLEKKIDNVQTLIDGYVKAQEEFKQEFVIMKEEVKIMKDIIKEKLGIEVRVI